MKLIKPSRFHPVLLTKFQADLATLSQYGVLLGGFINIYGFTFQFSHEFKEISLNYLVADNQYWVRINKKVLAADSLDDAIKMIQAIGYRN